jgi:hypothetical protein
MPREVVLLPRKRKPPDIDGTEIITRTAVAAAIKTAAATAVTGMAFAAAARAAAAAVTGMAVALPPPEPLLPPPSPRPVPPCRPSSLISVAHQPLEIARTPGRTPRA